MLGCKGSQGCDNLHGPKHHHHWHLLPTCYPASMQRAYSKDATNPCGWGHHPVIDPVTVHQTLLRAIVPLAVKLHASFCTHISCLVSLQPAQSIHKSFYSLCNIQPWRSVCSGSNMHGCIALCTSLMIVDESCIIFLGSIPFRRPCADSHAMWLL